MKLIISICISLYASYVAHKNGESIRAVIFFDIFYLIAGYAQLFGLEKTGKRLRMTPDGSTLRKESQPIAIIVAFSAIAQVPFLLLTTASLIGYEIYLTQKKQA
ncbi:MAG: hypothetical protein WCG55_01905 [bacterium]